MAMEPRYGDARAWLSDIVRFCACVLVEGLVVMYLSFAGHLILITVFKV